MIIVHRKYDELEERIRVIRMKLRTGKAEHTIFNDPDTIRMQLCSLAEEIQTRKTPRETRRTAFQRMDGDSKKSGNQLKTTEVSCSVYTRHKSKFTE